MNEPHVVYVLEGWFGDVEWRENIYESEADAAAECDRLWKTRTSDNGPSYARGLHKFVVEPVEVVRSSGAAQKEDRM